MPRTWWISIGAGMVLLLLAWCGYSYYLLAQTHTQTLSNLASTSAALTNERSARVSLEQELEREHMKNGTFADQINTMAKTVGVLDKLSQTDDELLAKYSKVYFLSEHYAPKALAQIDGAYVYPKDKVVEIHAQVAPHLSALLTAANADGVDLQVLSAFRSFSTQGALKYSYRMTYGSGANAFSADQGYSEHQLGTTVDFTTTATKGALIGFDRTPAYAWLTDHAHEYGFVLSYPKDNAYYQYEPWHWRYVGKKLATRLHQDGEYFYEMDQREIDSYLVYLFD